ncbi:hypothetical protein H7U12_05320 [Rufibacter sp. H-1]|uniref:Cyclophilin-like domain-containing protein n=2 Tax=Rufibacter sediminis TaxID=2762756 RepID=A0ABR6VR82_9BACT|nr:hypothetical protein [Rufibacter sediminis]
MKLSLVIIFSLLFLSAGFASCVEDPSQTSIPGAGNTNGNDTLNPRGSKMKISFGTSTFTATLYDNASATAFKALLPLTINMRDLNSNEKYYDFSAGLPTNAANPGTIKNGDLMLYGSRTLVLFYKTFPTPYSYTRLGRVNDPEGLAAALGSRDVTVTFELE